MRKHEPEVASPKREDWLTLFFIGLFIFAYDLLHLLTGKVIYQNFWHNPVFAPFGLLIGVLAMVGALILRNRKS